MTTGLYLLRRAGGHWVTRSALHRLDAHARDESGFVVSRVQHCSGYVQHRRETPPREMVARNSARRSLVGLPPAKLAPSLGAGLSAGLMQFTRMFPSSSSAASGFRVYISRSLCVCRKKCCDVSGRPDRRDHLLSEGGVNVVHDDLGASSDQASGDAFVDVATGASDESRCIVDSHKRLD